MRLDVFDSLEWLYPDSQVRNTPARKVRLESARGTRPGFQVLVTDAPPGAALRVEIEPLRRDGGGRLARRQVFHLLSVPVEENTGITGFTREGDKNPHVTRRAPFRVFDALRPLGPDSCVEAGANALLVQVSVPAAARPGRYAGRVRVQVGAERADVAVELRVHKARVPARGPLKVTNWFSVDNMARCHGLKPWSQGHWAMIRRYAELMARNRQNVFWAPLGLVQARKDRGGWRFNARRWERLIGIFFESGFDWIEGGHVAHRRGWDEPRFYTGGQNDIPATGPEGYAYLASLLAELRKVLRRHAWRGCYIQHVADEPHGPDVPDYRILCGIVRRCLPGIPLIDAVQNAQMAGALDIWVPLNSHYEQQRADWEAYRTCGDELWCYTCCVPGGRYLNRLLDQSLLRPRLMHWGTRPGPVRAKRRRPRGQQQAACRRHAHRLPRHGRPLVEHAVRGTRVRPTASRARRFAGSPITARTWPRSAARTKGSWRPRRPSEEVGGCRAGEVAK